MVLLQVNIILLQCGYLLVNVIQILIYRAYVYKKYPWINWKAAPNNQALSNRNRFLLNGVAWTVFNSTDTILLSIICGLAVSSIYAIYNLIYANLNMIIVIVYSSSYFVLGQTYHENRNEYFEKHDGIESFSSGLSFALLSIAYVLTLPFITLYTRGIHDVNYVDNWLPLLFCLVQIFSNSRLVCGNLINVCNRPDLVNKASIIEVIINITLSIGLGLLIGIHGVLIATIVALCYKTNFIIIISNKKLLGRSPWHTYKILGPNFIMFGLIVVATYFINLQITSYISLLICALIVAVIILVIFFVLNLIINPKLINVIKGFFGRMKHKKQ